MTTKGKSILDYSQMPKDMAWFSKATGSIPGLTYISGTRGLAGSSDYCIEISDLNAKAIEKAVVSNIDYNADFTDVVFDYYGGRAAFKGTSNQMIVLKVVRMIDYENSTCAWRMKNNSRQSLLNIVAFICDAANAFWDRVSHYDADLVDDLANAAATYNGMIGTKSISLASKVCRFFNLFCFQRDDYYAYDSVVCWTLDYFRNAYGLPMVGLPFTDEYKKTI